MRIQGLHFIINMDPAPALPYLELADKAIAGGADSIQFRHKGIYSREMFQLAKDLAGMCKKNGIPLIINDRIDIALAVNADGVHLGQTDIPVVVARRILGEKCIVGATAQTLALIRQAEKEGADYIGCGQIFPTSTKTILTPPLGLESLAKICAEDTIPILAIGGINEHNLDAVCKTGVDGVAIVSAIGSSLDPYNQTKKIKAILQKYANRAIPASN